MQPLWAGCSHPAAPQLVQKVSCRKWTGRPGRPPVADGAPLCPQQAARGQRALHLRAAAGGRLPAEGGCPVPPLCEHIPLRRRAAPLALRAHHGP